jgi:hypothetical protein
MDDLPEFADQYSTPERIRFVVVGAIAGAIVIFARKFWLVPWLRDLAVSAPCRMVFGSNGATVLWYAVFVGLPFFVTMVIVCTVGRRGLKILRDGQVPPLREKVFRPTRIQRGPYAQFVGYLHVVAFVPLVALTLWGCVQAAALSQQSQLKPANCAADSHAASDARVPVLK